MAKVYVRREEGLEGALKRFQRYCQKDGIIVRLCAFNGLQEQNRAPTRKRTAQ